MKKVQCVPVHGQTELSVVDLGTAGIWQSQEVKELTDEQALIILTNPNFTEVVSTPVASEQKRVAAPTVGSSKSPIIDTTLES